jgi:hypothetical protein
MESTPADKSAATETPYEQRIPSKLGERTQKGTDGFRRQRLSPPNSDARIIGDEDLEISWVASRAVDYCCQMA